MRPQVLASCANCWFNGLQHGSVGLTLGYCSEYRVVLRKPEETTCGRHMRKDLLFSSVETFNFHHRKRFTNRDGVQKLADLKPVSNGEFVATDTSFLRQDKVGEAAADYGDFDTKIESLAQLRTIGTFRAELAMLSLGRAYTDRCIRRGGKWTSGLHLLWWTKRRLLEAELPDPAPSDFRYATAGSLERQLELASWSLLMFRLVFISDVGVHAAKTSDQVRDLQSIAERAAAGTETPNKRKLLSWLKTTGVPMLEQALPEKRYRAITETLLRSETGT